MADSVGCAALWRVLGMGEREKKRTRGEKRRTYPLCAVYCGVRWCAVCGVRYAECGMLCAVGVWFYARCAVVCGVLCAVCCILIHV